MRLGKWQIALAVLAAATLARPVYAGTIILEGSDAIGLHSSGLGSSAANNYRDQTWSAIGGADPRPIATIGSRTSFSSNTHAVVSFSTLAAAGSLNNYVALYFVSSGGGCCIEDDSLIAAPADKTAVSNYLAAGGTIMIENYTGGAAWDFAVGTVGGGNAHVAGVGGGFPGGSSCSDGEKVTAEGLLNGFTQPGPIGCWTHQGYDQAGFFAALGFTHTFFAAGVDYPAGFSSLLSNGRTVTGSAPVPEPASLLLLGTGLAGFARKVRKNRK